MLRLACILFALLLTVPAVAAEHETYSCGFDQLSGLVDQAQCFVNLGIDTAEHVGQDGIGMVCIILFGEPC